ncbi:MAG: single-stranded DNA-binding protein [Candidatus Liptonbacteria bacterium]|nr:single-stranded DNA-binding protein [Candidatus Liptonbacteria bacterium]
MNLNKIFILGRLTADPQLRTTPSGQSVASFAVATNRVWTDKSGSRKESAEYHNVVAWGKQAEIASQFLTKGSMVLVEGRLQTRSWADRQGQQRKTTEVICERLQLGPRPGGGGTPRQSSSSSAPDSQPLPTEEVPVINIEEGKEEIQPEDLPF